jgi:allantoinase
VPLPTVAAATAGAVARRFRLAGKGELAVGADADLALVDLGAEHRLAAGDLRYRHRQSPFVGRAFRGRVVRTILRGTTVFRDGEIVSGTVGRLLQPA